MRLERVGEEQEEEEEKMGERKEAWGRRWKESQREKGLEIECDRAW